MLIALAATLFFLLLHVLVARGMPGQEFHVELKISRGLASVVLTLIGCYALSQWWWLWPQAFLDRHPRNSEIYYLICFVSGHFVADFSLIAWGWWRRNSPPRKDLIAHHAFGLAVCAVVFYYGFGHTLFAVALIGELMPATSGVGALGQLLSRPQLERTATRLRLTVLVLWRLPMWVLMTGIVLYRMVQGETDELMALAQRITLVCMAVVTMLDTYWVRLCLQSLRAPQRA